MTIERWGAFSVVDHADAKKLATEVLLYDRLLIPTPMDCDRERWIKKKWDPEGLEKRLQQLGEIAIPAAWDLDRQKDWETKFAALMEDVQDINTAYEMTRRVLVDQARTYRPKGVSSIEVYSAYQSESDFKQLDDRATIPEKTSELNFMVAQRICIPDEEQPEEALKRAIGLLDKSRFLKRRQRFYDWQHNILSRGILPEDAVQELEQLVREYNEVIKKSSRFHRFETVVLSGVLGAAALATFAGIAPAAFAGIGIGALKGAQVVTIGNAAIGAILQVANHFKKRGGPDDDKLSDMSGAMFHQVEEETGWKFRTED